MSPDQYSVATAIGATLSVGVAGAAMSLLVARRSVTAATVTAPLVAAVSYTHLDVYKRQVMETVISVVGLVVVLIAALFV